MSSLDRILLAVDSGAEFAGSWADALRLARAYDAELVLVGAVGQPEFSEAFDAATKSLLARFQELQGEAAEQGARVSSRFVVRSGQVGDVILAVADEFEVDLVLLGGHLLHGATAERVLAGSAFPVWLSRPEPHAFSGTVLCALDPSKPWLRILDASASLSRTLQARLVLITVAPPGAAEGVLEETRALQARALDSQNASGFNLEARVVSGHTESVLVEAAGERAADVLVVGSAQRRGAERLLRENTAQALLRRVPCALLVLQSGGGAGESVN